MGKTLPDAFIKYWALQRACEHQVATQILDQTHAFFFADGYTFKIMIGHLSDEIAGIEVNVWSKIWAINAF